MRSAVRSGGFARLGGAEGPPSPLQGFGHNGLPGVGWIGVPGSGVHLGNRGQPAGQGGGPVSLGERDQVEGHCLRRGRKSRDRRPSHQVTKCC